MPRAFYEAIADALPGFLPRELRAFGSSVTGHNVKVWFGDSKHEHYEVQQMRGGRLEIGFHLEHPERGANDDVLARVRRREKTWRRALGRAPEAGPFLGRREHAARWRRCSEVWDDADLDGDGTAIEAAERLARYIAALEAARR